MRENAELFVDDLLWDGVEPGGTANAIPWAYEPTNESVYIDATGLEKIAISPDSLREIADEAEAEFNDAENDTDTDDMIEEQPTPADRETVRDAVEEQTHTFDTTPVGPGLLVIYRTEMDDVVRGYDGLTRRHGWYVSMYYPDPSSSDKAVLMPIDEVPQNDD